MDGNLEELMQSLTLTQYAVGSYHWVHVTHINDPSNFFVRPTAYKTHLPTLEQYEGTPDPSRLRLGSIVVFKPISKRYHARGQIRNIRDDNGTILYDLFALDYGFIELSVSIDRIKKPVENFPMPATVLHCQLADCQPKKDDVFDKDAIEAMVFYVGKERAKMLVQGKMADNKYIVQLINTCPEDIATMMALTGYSCLGYDRNVISRMSTYEQPKLFYTFKQLKVGDTLDVRVQSGDTLASFYVCESEDKKKYDEDYKNIKEHLHRDLDFPAEDLKKGKPVAVYSDWHSRYERAIVKEVVVPKKRAVLQLVDWGNDVDVHIGVNRLKVLAREYYFLRPAMAIFCQAAEKQVNDKLLQRNVFPRSELSVTINKVGRHLESPNIVNISVANINKEVLFFTK